jgi:hypothetical protein
MNFTPLRFIILITFLGLGVLSSIAACSPTPIPTPITGSAISYSTTSMLQAFEDRGLAAGSGIISERSILPGIPDLSFIAMLVLGMIMGIIFFALGACLNFCFKKYTKPQNGGK